MYLFQKIEEVMMEYHDTRHIIAEFLLNEKDQMYQYTMDDIAKLTYTSKPTLVRFAKTLGFHGWKDFMRVFIEDCKYQEVTPNTIDPNYPFHKTDSYRQVIDNIAQLQVESIIDTSHLIKEEMLEKAVIRIEKARRIIVFGMKPNTDYIKSMQWRFLTIGKHIEIGEPGALGMLANTMTKDDCAIIFSYSGNNVNHEPMSFIQTFLDHQVPMIGITSGGHNYIENNIDCVFEMSSRERLYSKISTFATEQSALLIFNVIFACFFKKNYDENLIYKIENSKHLEAPRNATLKHIKED